MSHPIDTVLTDIESVPVVIIGARGSGKSTIAKAVVKLLLDQGSEVIAFDSSLSWWNSSPVEYRISVSLDKILKNEIESITNVVYEIGSLSPADRRIFIATIIKDHYSHRFDFLKKYGQLEFSTMFKPLVFVVEESNTIFDSYSLRRGDKASEVLNDFISIGRNLRLSALFVTTRCKGELSPSIRDRATFLITRLVSESDISLIKLTCGKAVSEIGKSLQKFRFVYHSEGQTSDSFSLTDLPKYKQPKLYRRDSRITVSPPPQLEKIEVSQPPARDYSGLIKLLGWILGLALVYRFIF